mgnify:CR=1 FL=1
MKQFGFRFWCANLIIVLSFIVLVVSLIGQFIASLNETIKDLLPILIIICSASALVFALFEAVLLYRSWKASATCGSE